MELDRIYQSATGLASWLERYGEDSWDHQSFFAGRIGRAAKGLYYRKPVLGLAAVAPMVFCECLIPSARRYFWKRQRFPIADAHYAMGFFFLSRATGEKKYYEKGVHFLEMLEGSRCPGFSHYCWGYPFDWETRNGTLPSGTPLITTTPYVYEALVGAYEIDRRERWLEILRSIVDHATTDIKDYSVPGGATTCSYTPFDKGGVVNASAYRAFLLTHASIFFAEKRYGKIAEGNLRFVLNMQKDDGSWPYALDSRDFVDHFHTCFVLKALSKIEKLTGDEECGKAIDRGVEYYVKNLFDIQGLPKPFAKAPRLTVYRRELYDYAECLNLAVLLGGRYPELDEKGSKIIGDLLRRWVKKDGSFKSRELFMGWDSVPMHRWAQAQLFRSLCFYLFENKNEVRGARNKERRIQDHGSWKETCSTS